MNTPDSPDIRTVLVGCKMCGYLHAIQLSYSGEAAWRAGGLIQDALPELTADERELLLSRTCGKCWDALFPEE